MTVPSPPGPDADGVSADGAQSQQQPEIFFLEVNPRIQVEHTVTEVQYSAHASLNYYRTVYTRPWAPSTCTWALLPWLFLRALGVSMPLR